MQKRRAENLKNRLPWYTCVGFLQELFSKNIKLMPENCLKMALYVDVSAFCTRFVVFLTLENGATTVWISFHFQVYRFKIHLYTKNEKKITGRVNYVHLALRALHYDEGHIQMLGLEMSEAHLCHVN